MRKDKPAIGETVPAQTPAQWRAQLGQDSELDQLITGERQFVAAEARINASESGLDQDFAFTEEILKRMQERQAEIMRLEFLQRDSQAQLVHQVIKHQWEDLLKVNTAGLRRRLHGMRVIK